MIQYLRVGQSPQYHYINTIKIAIEHHDKNQCINATIGAILVEPQSWHVFIGLSAMTKAWNFKEYLNGLNKMSRIREITVRRWLNGTKKRTMLRFRWYLNNVGKPSTELMQPVPKQYKLCVKTTIAELASSGQTYWKFTQKVGAGTSQGKCFAENIKRQSDSSSR